MRIIKHSDWSSNNIFIFVPNDSIRFDSICKVELESTENALCLNVSTKKEDYKLLSSHDDKEFLMKLGQDIAWAAKIIFYVDDGESSEGTCVETEVPKKEYRSWNEAALDAEKVVDSFKKSEGEAEDQTTYKINAKKYNSVAKRLHELGGKFEYWAEGAYKWILGLTIVECIAAFIVGFAFLIDGEGEILLYMLPCIVVWFVLGYLNASFVRFILRCISVDYLGKSEVVQNTYESAVAAKEKK
jgi:hypothetical protein